MRTEKISSTQTGASVWPESRRAVCFRPWQTGWGRRSLAVGLASWFAIAGCRVGSSGAPFDGSTDVDAPVVDAAYSDAWDRLQTLRATDPASDDVRKAANALLRQQPPAALRIGALLARAEQAYLVGDDRDALRAAESGLELLDPMPRPTPATAIGLAVVRLRAEARSGEPKRALAWLDDPLLTDAGLEEVDVASLRAVVLDRQGDRAAAFAEFVHWRELEADDTPGAAYAESRLRALLTSIPREERDVLARSMPESLARQCLLVGSQPTDVLPPWLDACRPAQTVGVMLPRSGRLSALADPHLAAVSVAAELLESSGLEWADSGSTPQQARVAARSLQARGVTKVIGPVGSANIDAALEVFGTGTELVIPGESAGGASVYGAAPSLENRVEALLSIASRHGHRRVVVFAPDNAYGRRGVAAVRRVFDTATTQIYPPETTSFFASVTAAFPYVSQGAPVIVLDQVQRAELVIRELARFGAEPRETGRSDGAGALVMSTAEGLSGAALGRGHEVLEGLWVAPVAAPSSATERFVVEYTARQGEGPSDQALLVYYAVRRALSGQPAPPARALMIRGGAVVEVEAN